MSTVRHLNLKDQTKPSVPKSNGEQTPPSECLIRYEFVLEFLGKFMTKVMHRPLLPLNCRHINIAEGIYNITHVEVFVDDSTVKVGLEFPEPVKNISTTMATLLEEGWHE